MNNINDEFFDDNFFINRLEKGIDTRILLFSNNIEQSALLEYESKYKNLKFDTFASDAFLQEDKSDFYLDNYDFILFFSPNYHNEEEQIELEEIAFNISNENNKRVSIGYVYPISEEKRPHPIYKEGLHFISFLHGTQYTEITYTDPNGNLLDFYNLVTGIHVDLEKEDLEKIKKFTKSKK